MTAQEELALRQAQQAEAQARLRAAPQGSLQAVWARDELDQLAESIRALKAIVEQQEGTA
ncbi:MAG: hypothetical protein ACK2U9_21180 [Anaerolineae bacterium]